MKKEKLPNYKIYPWTEEEDALITKLKKEGKDTKQIAAHIENHSYEAVRQRLKKLRLVGAPQRKWTDEEIKKLYEMRLIGYSWVKIGEKFKRTPVTCQNQHSVYFGKNKKFRKKPIPNIYKDFKKGEIFKTEEGRRLKFLRTIETKNRMHVFQHPAGWIETFTDAQLI